MSEHNSKPEFRWLIDTNYAVVFAQGVKAYESWYFQNAKIVVREENVFESEAAAVKAAKKSLRIIIAGYKEKLSALNKR